MKTYYEMLEVERTASTDEIKRAFRREIAKYHPDKVQHLGREFQEIAAAKAAELTQAYKTLSDEELRSEYDGQLENGGGAPPASYAPAPQPDVHEPPPAEEHRAYGRPASPPPPPPSAAPSSVFSQERAGASDLVQRATVMRFRQALENEFGKYEQPHVAGFEVTCVPKPPFWKLKLPPRVLARFVDRVDAATASESWALAARMKKDTQRDLCVFVMGPEVAPASELATAIAEQRRKPMPAGGKLSLVPVNTRTWAAHVPNDAPPVVKSLLTRLQTA